MIQLFGMALRGAAAFARSRVSLLGVRRFAGEVAGIYAIDEIVDLAKPYSKWVEQNEFAIKSVLTLGLFARNTGLAHLKRTGGLANAKIFFSKLPLAHPVTRLRPLLQRMNVVAREHGVAIMQGGQLAFEISVKGGKLVLSNKMGVAGGAVLAAGLGGTLPNSKEEWEATGQQLALHLSDAALTSTEYELRTYLERFSALSLLRNGSSYVDAFLRDYPYCSEEHAVSVLQDVLEVDSNRVGVWSIDAFESEDERQVIRINGTYYDVKEGSNTWALIPGEPSKPFREPSVETEEMARVITAVVEEIHASGGVSFIAEADTGRYLTSPFIYGKYGLMMVIDEKTGGLVQFILAQDTLFDSMQDNLNDDFGENLAEAGSRIMAEIGAWTTKQIADWIGVGTGSSGTYRSSTLYLGAEELYQSMGKW